MPEQLPKRQLITSAGVAKFALKATVHGSLAAIKTAKFSANTVRNTTGLTYDIGSALVGGAVHRATPSIEPLEPRGASPTDQGTL